STRRKHHGYSIQGYITNNHCYIIHVYNRRTKRFRFTKAYNSYLHSGNDFIFSEREVSMNKREIEQALRDYNWMIKEIKRQRELLGHIKTNIVSQSGLESSMPKAQGVTSDPVAIEVIRREKKSKWVEKLEEKVLFIQKRISFITNEREKAVLECMLDGLSMSAIGRHMGLSERHIRRLKDSIVSKMSEMSKTPNTSNSCVS